MTSGRTAAVFASRRRGTGLIATAAFVAATAVLGAAPAGAASCTLNLQGVAFASYDVLSNQSLDSAGSVAVNCDAIVSYSIALSAGHGTMLARQLQNGPNVLSYNLYTDLPRSTIWGDGTGGTALVNGSGTSALYTIYGRIPARQIIPAGTYTDTITVTLLF